MRQEVAEVSPAAPRFRAGALWGGVGTGVLILILEKRLLCVWAGEDDRERVPWLLITRRDGQVLGDHTVVGVIEEEKRGSMRVLGGQSQ